MPRPFEVQVRSSAGVDVLELHGQIDGSAGAPLDAASATVAASDRPALLLDFTDVDYINSTGIAHIVGVLARARTAHRSVLACGLTDHYREIFAITRLSDYMQMYDDVQAALGGAAATRA